MANAKECDTCKTFYKDKMKNNTKFILLDGENNGNLIDLCPSCRLELEKWYESRKEKFEK